MKLNFNTMKGILFFLALILANSFVEAQDVVLEKDVDEQYKGTKGPNMRHYRQFYFGFGGIADFDEEAGTSINPWKSGQAIFGYRYKLKLLSFYALGVDMNFKMNQYHFDGDDENPEDPTNPLANVIGEEKHSLVNNGIGLEFYQRINIGKRGNSLGKYLDTGIRGQWNMTNVEEYTLITKDDPYVGKTKIINRKLNYLETFSYGLSARIGINKFILYSYYRLSDSFKPEFGIPELSRLSFGAQIAF